MVKKRTTKSRNKRLFIIAPLILVIIIGLVLLIARKSDKVNESAGAKQTDTTTEPNNINLNPPTEADAEEAQAHKDDLAKQQITTPVPSTSKKKVTPVVSGADKNSVSAYVLGIFEDGGTCTTSITQGSQTFTRSSSGFENSSYTQCMPIDISSGMIDGTKKWTLTVSYTSALAEGTSDTATVSP
ncbi:hypothetical protein BH10PAT3_BH10PAT3_4000 [soil metagenome]